MGIVSYAQNFEDVMLWRALEDVPNGFYIDIGAYSPDFESVTRAFYENGWNGINVEPNPEFVHLLNERRPRDINLEVAVSDFIGRDKMAIIDNPGLSTMDRSVARRHIKSGYAVQYVNVDVVTLEKIFETYVPKGKEVHFLKIDVEGTEKNVIIKNDWEKFRPWIVVVEATVPLSKEAMHQEWESFLTASRYIFRYADGLNRFYVAEERAHLANYFREPPNFFDNFVVAGQVLAENRASEAETRAEKAEQTLSDMMVSYSWRITKPLRKSANLWRRFTGGIRSWNRVFVVRGVNAVIRVSWLRSMLLSILNRFPRIKARLRAISGIRSIAGHEMSEDRPIPRSERQLTRSARNSIAALLPLSKNREE